MIHTKIASRWFLERWFLTITTRDTHDEILISQQNGGFAWLIPQSIIYVPLKWCSRPRAQAAQAGHTCASPPLLAGQLSICRTGRSCRVCHSHRRSLTTVMRNSARCVLCCSLLVMGSYREENLGLKERDGNHIRRIAKRTVCTRKTDRVRASRGCRTSPGLAARGPQSSPRWCRCGWWSGTAATPTPAPSEAPRSGGTRRRSRHRHRLRWPGRPPRPRIKAP